MRACIQRVRQARVTVDGQVISQIENGLTVFLGIGQGDTSSDAIELAEKVVHLRIFESNDGKMNRSLLDTNGKMLVVSQFTLFGDCRKGRRPSFIRAALPKIAPRQQNLWVDFGSGRAPRL